MDFLVCCQHGASPIYHLANLLSNFRRERPGAVSNQTHQDTGVRFWGVLGGKGCTGRGGRGSHEAGCATSHIHIQHTRCRSLLQATRKSLQAFIFKMYRQKKVRLGQDVVLGRSLAPRQTPSVESDAWCGN